MRCLTLGRAPGERWQSSPDLRTLRASSLRGGRGHDGMAGRTGRECLRSRGASALPPRHAPLSAWSLLAFSRLRSATLPAVIRLAFLDRRHSRNTGQLGPDGGEGIDVSKISSRAAAWLCRAVAARGKKIIAWATAVAIAWTLDITAAVRHMIPIEIHGVTDIGTGSLTVLTGCWLIARHYAGPRLKPGQRIVSDETYRAEQEFFMEMLAMTHYQGCAEPRQGAHRDLRAV